MADHHYHHHPSIGKACKSFVLNCYHDHANIILSPKKSNTKSIEYHQFKDKKKWEEVRNASKRSLTSTRGNPRPNLSRTLSTTSTNMVVDHGATKNNLFSRSINQRGGSSSTAIMYSNSNGIIKPPPIEMNLECMLEELCFGCVKDIKIIRDTLTNDGRDVIQEDEMVTIKVKPGWTKGTKITFEAMGNKMPGGAIPSDVVFTVAQKKHPLYTREGDDLELAMKVPLVKALTGGCSLSIPILGGKKIDFTLNDIIYPGYTTVIPGQGMPNSQEQGKRGDLIIKFLVEFPTKLTDAQRSDIVNILQNTETLEQIS